MVHHCRYSKRAAREKQAVTGLLAELQKMGLSNFDYEETVAGFPRKPDRDIVVMAAMGAFVCRRYSVGKVLLCYSKEESRELDAHLKLHRRLEGFSPLHRYTRANEVFQQIYRKNRVEFYLMDQHKGLVSRETMIKDLPDNVLRHVSFCREPTPQRRICGMCFTCRRTVPFLKKHNKLSICSQES